MKTPLEQLIDIFGSQKGLADALNADEKPKIAITQSHVWKWVNKTKDGIPAEHVIPAGRVSQWKITPHQLRPDLYPHETDGLPEHLRKQVA
jgi:DNA-binding transcriptional regulator YdaS (Cro superfamily)